MRRPVVTPKLVSNGCARGMFTSRMWIASIFIWFPYFLSWPLYCTTATARRNAARASSRVESSVGNGEFTSFMISGISCAAQHNSVATPAPILFHAPDDALKRRNRLRFENAVHQLIHYDAIDFLALRSVGAEILQPPRSKLFQDRLASSTSQRVPVSPMRRNPRSTACSATTSAMCSHGSGDCASIYGSAWWIVLSGQIREIPRQSSPTCSRKKA